MNYFLVAIVLGIAGFAYYQHNQDEQQVTDLQQQIADLKKAATDTDKDKETAAATTVPSGPAAPAAPVTPDRNAVTLSPAVHIVAPTGTHSSAIDAAANAATSAAASGSNNLGTVTTLDGRTFQNCKVLKVESDGVTFSHDDGITKVLFPLLPPAVQKQFDYNPQKAVAQTEAQVRYDQQQTAATPAAATNTAPAPASP
jgi:hypothetical protein